MSKVVIASEENMGKCICGQCPSYDACMKENKEGLYCSPEIHKSACDFEKKGCVCGTCPVQIEHELEKTYYCKANPLEDLDFGDDENDSEEESDES